MSTDEPQPGPPAEELDTVSETPDSSAGEEEQEPKSPGREGQKLRKRLRSAEAQRDALAEQLTSIRRDQVAAIAAVSGVKAEAVWATCELKDLLAKDGTVDDARVNEAITQARKTLGLEGPRREDPTWGAGIEKSDL